MQEQKKKFDKSRSSYEAAVNKLHQIGNKKVANLEKVAEVCLLSSSLDQIRCDDSSTLRSTG